ncbi:MAG: phosphatidylglycerophosphatase A [Thiovulaceae bacterium]|nr:phosphatidylglycerophosphatase A [Sulfurimonadaceae bacterium]
MREFFITFFYVGKIPFAPGTFGTFAAIPFALVILMYLSPSTLFLSALLLTVVSVKFINDYEKTSQTHDEKKIVIDEVAGVWLAISIAPGLAIPVEAYQTFDLTLFIPLILSVIYFRIFDIWKPSFIGRIDRQVQGGWGVMGDDILAGLAAGISSALTYQGIIKLALIPA